MFGHKACSRIDYVAQLKGVESGAEILTYYVVMWMCECAGMLIIACEMWLFLILRTKVTKIIKNDKEKSDVRNYVAI